MSSQRNADEIQWNKHAIHYILHDVHMCLKAESLLHNHHFLQSFIMEQLCNIICKLMHLLYYCKQSARA